MSEPEAPKIEFPCDYPIKVLGRSGDEFQQVVMEIFERHAPGYDRESLSMRASQLVRDDRQLLNPRQLGPAGAFEQKVTVLNLTRV